MRKLVLLLNSSFSLSLMQIVNEVPVMKINLIKNASLVPTHVNQAKSVLLADEIDVTQLQSKGDLGFSYSCSCLGLCFLKNLSLSGLSEFCMNVE